MQIHNNHVRFTVVNYTSCMLKKESHFCTSTCFAFSAQNDSDDFQQPVEKRKSVALKGKERFTTPLSDKKMAKVCEGYIPANTSKNTQWAVRSFHEWR